MLLLLATLLFTAQANEPVETQVLAETESATETDAAVARPDDEPLVDSEDEAATEIIVFGELLVQQARQEVIDDLKRQGFNRIKKKNGVIIMKNDTVYKGKVVLHEDGWMVHKRQGFRAETPDSWFKENAPPLSWMPCITQPNQCFRAGGIVISPRKLQHIKTKTHRAVGEDLATLSDRVADLSVDRTVNDLPERLEACWERGEPLDGDVLLATDAERLEHIVAFLESRSTNPWGERVRQATQAYIRGVIQHEVGPELLGTIEAYL